LYIVTAYVEDGKGRQDASTGAVCIKNLKGDDLANAIMKAETKAKRRATLSICGLGILDESETDTIGEYKKMVTNPGKLIEREIKEIINPPMQSEKEAVTKSELFFSYEEKVATCGAIDELQEVCNLIVINKDKFNKDELIELKQIYRDRSAMLSKTKTGEQ